MPLSDRLSAIRNIYDQRAPFYDQKSGFHAQQAADYLKWASIQPSFHILDLACGTGALTIPFAKATGLSGSVFGVDISPASLAIAREKASKQDLQNVTFIEHDITKVRSLSNHGISDGKFDLITCASAFLILENPSEVVKSWAKLLKSGGKVIFDTLAKDAMVKNVLLERVANKLQIDMLTSRSLLVSEEKLKKLLTDAGLDASESFVTDRYEPGTEELQVGAADETFYDVVAKGRWTKDWYLDFVKPDIIDRARTLFREELVKIADEDGKFVSYLTFNMAVGRKV